MIRIQIARGDGKAIRHFTVSGHAGYAQAGEDIVCAAVSAIVQTAILGITDEAGLDVNGLLQMDDGYVALDVPQMDVEQEPKVRTILNTMALGLKSVGLAQPEFVLYQERRWQPCSK